ncbi:MAG: outer membrane lipid asymmetry maintenance protein MlaD [Deltaproteobacteria bacterium]|nr:outer membrane lipid asymmetry maintenance protein MlaD [Deltaproteobacteria bacterium]MBW2723113.1 outer membrane lipid asymmetry maintenance protein MlaD [Deltaproteobacteria bacterium]
MKSSQTDLIVGAFVLLGLGAIAYLSLQVGGMSYTGPGGFKVVATFDEIGGLTSRAPVVISGVKVGQVTSISLDDDLRAEVVLDVRPGLELTVDTSASIRTSGLLGNQFISLEPGGEIDLLADGESVDFTESALNLEKLIGTFMHGSDLEE